MQKQELLQINDAAYVYWPEGRKKPKTQQLHGLAGAGALGGSFWGLLFGLIFFVPLLGMAVGAAMGALAGSMSDVGIDDEFIRTVREQVTPGTSALFVMTSNVVADKVLDEFRATGAALISTNLSSEQEARLREAFAETEHV
ncbi:membrane protein [Pseudonocardia asaccharolytica DSM 44247 = NBRC 16224]|uniref:Membrane protein n=2 Tax=Pseudonocardia asaccharolytica TaxID=54010 RepID=A0A511D4R4_9PSEU|nr:membrane protein [Pseudonocardia asaccharolytica DSM 44247 = NBRC 16224]